MRSCDSAVPYNHKEAARAADAAASQELRRQAWNAFQHTARISSQQHRPQGFRGLFDRSLPDESTATAEKPAARPAAASSVTAGPAAKARAFIFQTAATADDGRRISTVFRDALRRIHPDFAGNRNATMDSSMIDRLKRARRDLKDAGLWS